MTEAILGWLIFSIVVAALGSKRKIGFAGAFFLSLLLSPLIGLIITLTSKSIETEKYETEILETQKKQQETLENISKNNLLNIADDLKKIKELLDSGVINQEEFDKMKKRLIDSLDKSSILAIKQNKIKSNDIVEQNEKHFDYTAPGYKIIKQTEESSLFGGITDKYLIEFNDSEKGEIYVIRKNKRAYFNGKPEGYWINVKYIYADLESCVNAIHYFIKNRKELKTGFINKY